MNISGLALVGFALLLYAAAAPAWSARATALAQQAEREFPERVVVVGSLAEAQLRQLPDDALRKFADAEQNLFAHIAFRGVIAPFRNHWFDEVRCAIYVPHRPEDTDAELWVMAHEIGHCVARLNGWQDSLWNDPDVLVRHRTESWADAFATMLLRQPTAQLPEMALRRRAQLGDAAYMTERAIRCGLDEPIAALTSLTAVGQTVEKLIVQPPCLVSEAVLRATAGFLESVQ